MGEAEYIPLGDLLNMLTDSADSVERSVIQPGAMSAAFALTKRERRTKGRVEREIARLQAKLAAVTALKV